MALGWALVLTIGLGGYLLVRQPAALIGAFVGAVVGLYIGRARAAFDLVEGKIILGAGIGAVVGQLGGGMALQLGPPSSLAQRIVTTPLAVAPALSLVAAVHLTAMIRREHRGPGGTSRDAA